MAQKEILGSDWLQSVNDNFDELYLASLTVLASDAEALAKTSTTKAVTPKNLAAMSSTDSFAGLVELATNSETLAGTDTSRAVTPEDLAYVQTNTVVWSFAGKNGAGACTLAGAKVDDVVLSVTGIAAGTVGDQSGKFESTVTVADELQQSDEGDLSSNIYLVRLLRKS